jgi:hypothetical protein
MRIALLPAVIRFALIALLATIVILLHVHLALRARRETPNHGAAAWLPGAGALFVWRAGGRVAPVVYGAAIVAYVILRITG